MTSPSTLAHNNFIPIFRLCFFTYITSLIFLRCKTLQILERAPCFCVVHKFDQAFFINYINLKHKSPSATILTQRPLKSFHLTYLYYSAKIKTPILLLKQHILILLKLLLHISLQRSTVWFRRFFNIHFSDANL